jgi:hypothetical protein
MIYCTATSQTMHGSGQAKPKPGQSQHLWLGLKILEAKASGFQAKPSQNITRPHITSFFGDICDEIFAHAKSQI